MDSSAEIFQTTKEFENVLHDADEMIVDWGQTILSHNHNGLNSSNENEVNKSLEDQDAQPSLPTPEINDVLIINLEKELENQEAIWHLGKEEQYTFILWEKKLRNQDAIWQKMFEQNWQLDLYSLCSKYFREVKQEFGDDKLFQQWFEKQKKTYPHRTTYQRIKL